ncbi:GspH/FimT family pseudopilin [Halomonas sediminis]
MFAKTDPQNYNHPQCGLSLIELLVALSLAAIIATWGIPSFQALGERTALSSEVMRIKRALTLARNTAITRQSKITLCPANAGGDACENNWSGPLMIIDDPSGSDGFSADTILRTLPATPHVTVTYNREWKRMRYDILGHASGYNGRFTVCPAQGNGSEVILSQLGRVRVKADIPCPP